MTVSKPKFEPLLASLMAVATLAASLPSSADAAVRVQAPTFTTTSGGSFDVPVQFTAAESPFQISGYYVDLRVTRLTGTGTLSLTGGGPAAVNPVGLTPMFFATPGATPPGGNFNADSSDSTFGVSNGTGLFSVNYAVTGTGTFGLSFVTAGGDPSNLYNAVSAAPVPPIEFAGGTVTVGVVPEPAVASTVAVLGATLFLRRRTRCGVRPTH
jgi:hypothetical protein